MSHRNKNKKGGMVKNQRSRKESDHKFEVDYEEKQDLETFKMLNELFKDPQQYGLEDDQIYLYHIVSTKFVDKWEDYIKGKSKNPPDMKVNHDLLDKEFYSSNDYVYKYSSEKYIHLNQGLIPDLKLNRDFMLCSPDAWDIIEKKHDCVPVLRKFDLYNGKFHYLDNIEFNYFVMIDDIKNFDSATLQRYVVQWDDLDSFAQVVNRLKIEYYGDLECKDFYSFQKFDGRQDFENYYLDEIVTVQRNKVNDITEVGLKFRGFPLQHDYHSNCYDLAMYDLIRCQSTILMVRSASHDEEESLQAKLYFELMEEPILPDVNEICEYCKKSREILLSCTCRHVYYCSLKCRVKDIEFHDKICSVSKNVIQLIDYETIKNAKNHTLSIEYDPEVRTGLFNLDNTCYMSSILQILIRIPDFMTYLLQKDFTDMLNYDKTKPKAQLLPYFSHTFRKIFGDCQKSAYAPWIIKAAVGVAHEMFSKFNQNDVHEFFTFVLDKLGDEMVSRGDEKILHNLLSGQYEVSKKCQNCEAVTKKKEDFLFVNMPIPQLGEKIKVWVKCVRKQSPAIEVFETDIKKTEALKELNKKVGEFLNIDEQNYFQCISDGTCIQEIIHDMDLPIKELIQKIEEKRNTNLYIWAFEIEEFWSFWDAQTSRLVGKKLLCYTVLKKIKSINSYINQKVPTGLLMVELVDDQNSFLDVYKIACKKVLSTDFQPEKILFDFTSYEESSQKLQNKLKNYISKKLENFEKIERNLFDKKIRQDFQYDTRSKFSDLSEWTDIETGYLRYLELECEEIEDEYNELNTRINKNCREIPEKNPLIDYNDLFISQLFQKGMESGKSYDMLNVKKYNKMIEGEHDKDTLDLKKDFDKEKLNLYDKSVLEEIIKYGSNFSNMESVFSYTNKTSKSCAMCKKNSCRSCQFVPNNSTILSKAIEDDFVNISVSFNLEINKIIENYLADWNKTYETSVKHENNVVKKRIVTLQSCIEKMTDEEDMDEDCLVDCDSCNNKTRNSQKTDFLTIGSQLIIVLKRFRVEFYDNETIKVKNNILVEFEDILNINENEYQLFGVVDHLGKELDKGHYVTNVQMNDGQWITFDDDEIKDTRFKNVVSEKAYMLFYRKIE